MKYQVAALGGTFDRFHSGHAQLLRTALESAERIIVGIAREQLIQHKILTQIIEPYEMRVQNVNDFVTQQRAANRVDIIPLTDLYGPTLTDPLIDVIVVSTQTKKGGEQINAERGKRGLGALPIIEAQMVRDEMGDHLSSTEIRQGFVTRSGKAFATLFDQDIHLSPETLNAIKQPQGELLQSTQISAGLLESRTSVVLVGDTITKYFVDKQLPFHLAIIDGHTERQPIVQSYPIPLTTIADNPAGMITSSAAGDISKLLSQSAHSPHLAMTHGEEDLLAFVPAILGPLGGAVFYGQPKRGIVMIELTEAEKMRLTRLINPSF